MTATMLAAVDIAAFLRGEDGARRDPVRIDIAPPPPCPGHARRGDFCAAVDCEAAPQPSPLDRYAATTPVEERSLLDAAAEIGEWAGFRSAWAGDSPAVIAGLIFDEVLQAIGEPDRYGIAMPEVVARDNAIALAMVTALEMAGLSIAKNERLSDLGRAA